MPFKNTMQSPSTSRHTTIRLAPEIYKIISDTVRELRVYNRAWSMSAIANVAISDWVEKLGRYTDDELNSAMSHYQTLTHTPLKGRKNGKATIK